MKLNKIMKKTVLATMAVLMAASLSFTGCSNGDDDPTSGPTPTGSDDNVLFEIDFSKVADEQGVATAFEDVYYCSDNTVVDGALKVQKNAEWGAIEIGHKEIDLTNAKIKIEYKQDEWKWAASGTTKLTVGVITNVGTNATEWKPFDLRTMDLAEGIATEYTTKEAVVANGWNSADKVNEIAADDKRSGQSDVTDLKKINRTVIKFNQGTGTLYIKSIKFYK